MANAKLRRNLHLDTALDKQEGTIKPGQKKYIYIGKKFCCLPIGVEAKINLSLARTI